MKRLSFVQNCIMIGLVPLGSLFIALDLFFPISITVGYTFVTFGILLMVLECGPRFWYWWVPFGLGVRYKMNKSLFEDKYEEIEEWMEENLGDSIKYYSYYNEYYFLSKTDAMAFKLMWEE